MSVKEGLVLRVIAQERIENLLTGERCGERHISSRKSLRQRNDIRSDFFLLGERKDRPVRPKPVKTSSIHKATCPIFSQTG